MTPAQLTTLRNDIVATPAFNSLPNNADTAAFIAAQYNLGASPSFTVWKTEVTITAIGDAIDAVELAGLSTLNATRLQTLVALSPGIGGVNPSLLNRRKFFDDIFSGSGGTNTRASLLILWKRSATRVEKLFATGTGSDASPATLTFQGIISGSDVAQARES